MEHKHEIRKASYVKDLAEGIEEALEEGFEIGAVYLIKKEKVVIVNGKTEQHFTTRFSKDPQWSDALLAELLTADIEHLKKRDLT